MTLISQVEVSGFKSFRKKTVVPFFGGLTAIVGENGSGKSNLFDAISFVMGRRSSQMRADRAAQLIFNGGDSYSPSQHAQVVLHLDNRDGTFNEFLDNGDQPPEITIARRITEKSSSYYFMGKTCPRSQIDELLEEARIDPDGQQLIAQGSITEVIKRSPTKRREIIDEVCGIAAYDQERNKAINELKQVKSKLNTHRIVLAERRRQLTSLEQERNAAIEYQQLTKEHAKIEESIRHQQRKQAEKKLLSAQKEREGMGNRTGELEKLVEKLDLDIENKNWELEGIRDKLEDGNQEIGLVKEVERQRSDIITKQGEINHRRQQVRNLQDMIDEVSRLKAAQAKSARSRSSGPNRAVQAIIERNRGGVYGIVRSLASPKSGFEVAFETATGGHLNDVVVDSRETAIQCINYLKENQLGRARVLPLRRLVTRRKSLASADALKLSGVIDYAINLVEFEEKYRRAFEYILYDTVVAKNLEALKGVDGVRAVTLDGDIQSKGGAMTGGSRPSNRKKQPGIKSKDSTFDTVKKRQQISKLNREIDQIKDEVAKLNANLEDKEKQLREKRNDTQAAKGKVSTQNDELRSMREKRRKAVQQLENLRRSLSRYERQEAEAKASLESFEEEKHDDSYYIQESVQQLERKLSSAARRIKRLEPINMRAIQEYDNAKEEFNTFKERVDSLETEKHEIELLIGDIEERKKQRFQDALAEVSTEFRRIFVELFAGGQASLELEQTEDISSGLLIRANPPDKEPHLIDSLSGGEQALTATAFILALQEYQDAPFFILDEIDAALDLINATRLAQMLERYAKKLQVIVVSHNQETIRHADRAYGVTMKNGVSNILSINLN